MPVTSHQMGSMIAGQQAMFGNFASYASQISPGGQGGGPTYPNPMQGGGAFDTPPPFDVNTQGVGARSMSWMGNVGLPAMGTAAMVGSFLPGAAGNFFGQMDISGSPLAAFGRGSGLTGGSGDIIANARSIMSGGVGGIARAGIGGVGAAAGSMVLPTLAIKGAQYAGGQMLQGAQFNDQVHNFMRQNFRHQSQSGEGGIGFTRQETGQVASMVRTMGHEDMFSGPQELNRIMQKGTQMGLFKAVQDVKQFKTKFKETVDALKSISETMHTTLEGAMPFFDQARKQGFWTPGDITKHAATARATATNTGLSVAQVQQQMAVGGQMARMIGANTQTGAEGMQAGMNMVGGAVRSGVLSQRDIFEATGEQGSAGIQIMAQQMGRGSARFASGRKGRWLMAAMGGKGMQGLDEGMLAQLEAGDLSIGQIRRGAEQNLQGEGRWNFRNNEKELRGELLRRGPRAAQGFAAGLAGKHLYSDSGRSKAITRRMFMRHAGAESERMADAMAKVAREGTRVEEEAMMRISTELDTAGRQKEQALNKSLEGWKRMAAQWWDTKVKGPLQEMGAGVSGRIEREVSGYVNKFWGRGQERYRFRGADAMGLGAMQSGDEARMNAAFGSSREGAAAMQLTGAGGLGSLTRGAGGWASGLAGAALGGIASSIAGGSPLGVGAGMGIGWEMGKGDMSNKRIETLVAMGMGEHGFKTEAERDAAVKGSGGRLMSGAHRTGSAVGWRAMDREGVSKIMGMGLAGRGQLTQHSARDLNYSSLAQAKESLGAARTVMQGSAWKRAQTLLRTGTSAQSGWQAALTLAGRAKAGEFGSEMKELVGDNVTVGAYRLNAGQNKGMRKGSTSLGLAEGASEILGGPGEEDFSETETSLSRKMEGLESELASAASGNITGTTTLANTPQNAQAAGYATTYKQSGPRMSTDDVGILMQSGGEGMKKGLSLWAAGDKEGAKKEFEALLGGGNVKDKDAQNVLRRILTHGESDQKLDHVLTSMGKLTTTGRSLAMNRLIARRYGRFRSGMENEGGIEQTLSGMEAALPGSGGAMRRMLTDEDPTAREHMSGMQEFVEGALSADSKQLGRAQGLIKGVQGGDTFKSALMGSRALRGVLDKWGGRGGSQQMSKYMSQVLNVGVSTEQIQRLTSGKSQEVIDELTKDMKEGTKKNLTRDMLSAAANNDEQRMKEVGVRGVLARSHAQLGSPGQGEVDRIRKGMKDTLAGDFVAGTMGTQKGIHASIERTNMILAQILDKEGHNPFTGDKLDKKKVEGS